MDKWLDKLMDNRTFMKLAALVMALLLFGSIYDSNNQSNDIDVPGEQDSETIEDIPVKSYYDTDNLVISGVPQTAKVTLTGPKPNLQNAKAQKQFEVYVDLTKAKVGKQQVKLQIKNLSEKLSAEIEPKSVEVIVQEKITVEREVDIDFNKKMVAEGYESDEPIAKPGKVKITGGREDINRIRFVKVIVEGENLKSTIDKSMPVYALDNNFKPVNVIIEPKNVRVTIPIKQATKKVQVEIVETGTPPPSITIDSITIDPKVAIITGSEEALNKTDSVRVEVDVSAISGNIEMPLPIIIPEGIKAVEPKTVKAAIKVTFDSQETITSNITTSKTFSNLQIHPIGLPEEYSVSFQNPPGGKTSITVKGTSEEIEKIEGTNFQLSFNAANLKEGEQEVPITVKGPENTDWTVANDTARIIVQTKQLNEEEPSESE